MYPRVLMSLLSAVTLVACGSNSDTPPADGGSLDDAGATDGGAGEDGGADAGVVSVTTATVTFKGVTSTVPIAVRRGLSFFQRTVGPIATSTYGNATTLSCAPNAAFAAGGRVISAASISVSISGPVVGNCATNQAQIPAAEGQIAGFLRNQCGGGPATCTYDATAALDTYLGGCTPQNLLLTVQYECRAMDPGPAFVIDTGALGIVLSGLEAPGSHSCAARGARFAVDGVPAETSGTCRIDITERDDRTLVGTVDATLAPASIGGATRPLTMTFEHNRNQLYPVVAVNTGSDLCLTNTVTHTVRTEAGETYDDFVGAAPVCQVAGTTLGPITFTRRRARTGSSLPQEVGCAEGRFNVDVSGVGSTANPNGTCQAAYAVSESDEVLRFVTQTLDLCPSGGGTCAQRPFIYMAYGFGDASAPLL